MRSFGRFGLGLAVFVIVAELVLRLLPVGTSTRLGYHDHPDALVYPPHHTWRVATGWDLRNAQTLRSNNAGYVADRDFEANPDAVALIGDSFVEASMLPADVRPGAQLERALCRRPVYAMGGPGSSLLDYAERVRVAAERYGTRDFVVLAERGDVRQSLCGSGNVHAHCIDPATLQSRVERQPAASTAKAWLRESALAQYLASQLKLSPARLWQQVRRSTATPERVDRAPTSTSASHAAAWPPSPEEESVIDAFLARIRPYTSGQFVLVVDAHRAAIQRGTDGYEPQRERLMARARAAGLTVIDAAPLYRRHFAQSSLSLDVGPYDAHLNAAGVASVAQAAAAALGGACR